MDLPLESGSLRERRLWREPTFWCLTLLVAGFYLARLDQLTIRGEESRRGRIAWEMLQTGDWLVPRVQGVPRLSRPPLHYWTIAATGWVRGQVDVWAVRLPSVIATLLTVWLIYAVARRVQSPAAAFCAGLAYASFPQVLQLGRLGETEALFTLTLSAALLFWHSNWSRGTSTWLVWPGAYALLALATLAKGPQAPVYFGAGVGAYLWWTGQWRQIVSLAHVTGIAVWGALVLAWQIPFSQALGKEGVSRVYLSEVAKRFEDTSLWTWATHLLTFPAEILLGCLGPWSLLLLAFALPEVRQRLRQAEAKPLADASTFWTICILVAFPSVWIPPEARSRYFMPLYPCFALLCGTVAELCLSRECSLSVNQLWQRFAQLIRWGGLLVPAGVCAWGISRGHLETRFSLSLLAYCGMLWALHWWLQRRAGLPVSNVSVSNVSVSNVSVSNVSVPPRQMALQGLSLALLLGLTAVGPGLNDQILRSNDTAAEVAHCKAQLPPAAQLHSFGVVHHLFSYHFGEEIIHHDFPTPGTTLPADVDYFCFDAGKRQMADLQGPWVEIARVNCDRAQSTKPECEVILAQRVINVAPSAD